MITFSDVGVSSEPTKTKRSIVYLNISSVEGYSGETYSWAVYVPQGVDLTTYLNVNAKSYENDIIRKEVEWSTTPTGRTITDELGNTIIVPVSKNEIVKPTIPDSEEIMSDSASDLGAIKRLLTILTSGIISNTGITQQHIDDLTVISPVYQRNMAYKVGDVFSFELKLWEVIQAHTSQDDWYPPTTPALYKIKTPAGVIAEWVQPTGAQDDYQIGDKVTHLGFTWESTAENNVWEPGIYGWVKI